MLNQMKVTHRARGELRAGRLYDWGYPSSARPSDSGLTTSHLWPNAGRLVIGGELKPDELELV
jgi:hypothetical protein